MAKQIPNNFQTVPPVVATFPFSEIREGTGTTKFYGAIHNESGTDAYYLTTSAVYSNDITSVGSTIPGGDTDWKLVLDKDFDVNFNLPQDINGKAYLNISVGGTGGGSGTGSTNLKLSGMQLIKVSNSVETVLATATSDTFTFSNTAVTTFSKTLLTEIDLSGGPYHFQSGDTLRLNVQLWGQTTGTAGCVTPGWGNDPADRDDPTDTTILDADTTKMELYIPFDIDPSA